MSENNTDAENEAQVNQEIGDKFDQFATGKFTVLRDEESQAAPDIRNLEANVVELQTRLSLLEESHAVAVKERDAADSSRRKLEKTLAEFLARFASIREAHSVALKEVDKLTDARRGLEREVSELGTQFAAEQEARATQTKERDQLATERDELATRMEQQHGELAEAHNQLNKFREMAVSNLEPLAEEHRRGMQELTMKSDAIIDAAIKAKEDSHKHLEALEQMVVELKSQVKTVRRDVGQRLDMVLGTTPANESGQRTSVTLVATGTNGACQHKALAGHAV